MSGENMTFLEDEFEEVRLEPDDANNPLSPTNGDSSPSKKHKGQDGSPSGAPVPPGVGAFLTGGRDSVNTNGEEDSDYEVEEKFTKF